MGIGGLGGGDRKSNSCYSTFQMYERSHELTGL